jgi:hydrogenase maturation protease
MNAALVDGIVKAVLYEGYMLYPYRPSAIKNRQRFNFGVVYPRAYSETQGGTDAWTMQTECLVLGNQNTHCEVRVRFLRMVDRTVEKVQTPSSEPSSITEGNIEKVERLEANARVFQAWQEATEEQIDVPEFNLSALIGRPLQWPFRFSGKQEREAIRDEHGLIAGFFNRRKASIAGLIDLAAEQVDQGVFKLTARVQNDSLIEFPAPAQREQALARSLLSAHTILGVREGEFVSLVDPPEAYHDLVQTCRNEGTWPVLVGEDGQRDTLLSSPIILYDYPQIAPESPGDLFDGAEIDEILSLRIMTMTDEEKREMRQSDERARQILERTENLPEEQLMKLHGALRGLRNVGPNSGPNIRKETP